MKIKKVQKWLALTMAAAMTLQMTVTAWADTDGLPDSQPSAPQSEAADPEQMPETDQGEPEEPSDSEETGGSDISSAPGDNPDPEAPSETEDNPEADETPKPDEPPEPDQQPEAGEPVVITGFTPLPEKEANLVVDPGTPMEDIPFPHSLEAIGAHGEILTLENISWSCPDYTSENQIGQKYTATAVLPKDIQLAPDVQPPEITITVGVSLFIINDRILVDGVEYKEINDTQVQVVGYNDDFSGAAVIPGSITRKDGKSFEVVGIEAYAFQNCERITSLDTGPNVKYIGEQAFQGSKVAAVTFGPGLTRIDEYAFKDCASLENIVIPGRIESMLRAFYNSGLKTAQLENGATFVGASAFESCYLLKEVIVPEGVTRVGPNAFENCFALEEISLPNSLQWMEGNTFKDSGLTKFTVPENLEQIPYNCFWKCEKLSSFKFNDKVTNIGAYAFLGCTLLDVEIPQTVTSIGEGAFGLTGITSVKLRPGTNFSIQAFENCKKLSDVQLAEGIVEIPRGAFYGCESLTEIALPESLRVIGREAFSHCKALKNINFPAALEEIGIFAFSSSGLENVEILSNLTRVGEHAFSYCKSLQTLTLQGADAKLENQLVDSCDPAVLNSVVLKGSFASMEEGAFSLQNGTFTVTVPDTATGYMVRDTIFDVDRIILEGGDTPLPSNTFTVGGLTYIINGNTASVDVLKGDVAETTAVIPGEVTYDGTTYQVTGIRDSAFTNIELTAVTIPDTVTTIGNCAFQGCSALTSVDMGKSVVSLGGFAFANCDKLESIDLPDGLEKIGEYAFYYSGLTSLKIPSKIREIPQYMASMCDNLNSVQLPEGLESIGEQAFCNSDLEIVHLPDSVTYIGKEAFYNCDKMKVINLPQSLTTLQTGAFRQCGSLKSIEIPQNLTFLSSELFKNCRSLESVTFADYHQSMYIGPDAFYNCTNLTSIALPEGTNFIDNNAFESCTQLKTVTLPSTLSSIGNYAFKDTPLTRIDIPDSVSSIGEECFWDCPDLGVAFIGSGVWTIGLRAFPTKTQLITNDPRVQLLLVEYLSQNENARPLAQWDGKSSIPAAAVVAAANDLLVTSDISIAAGAELHVFNSITVRGHLRIDGKVILEEGGAIIVAEGGRVDGSKVNELPIQYTVTAASTSNGSITVEKPFYPAGSRVTVQVKPEAGYLLKTGSLKYGETEILQGADGTYSFLMPSEPVTVTGIFDNGIAISGPTYPILMDGKTLNFSIVVPEGTNTDGADFRWTADPADAVILTNADTDTVTVAPTQPVSDLDVTLTVELKSDTSSVTGSKVIRVSTMKGIVIQENPRQQFHPGDTFTFTAAADTGDEIPGGVDWASSDNTVATVNGAGVVTFVGVGNAEISASSAVAPDMKDSRLLNVVLDVRGTLTFPDGAPGAYKTVDVSGGTLTSAKSVVTDATGGFKLEGLGQGVYQLRSRPNQGAFQEVEKSFSIAKGADKAEWALRYGASAIGTVSYTFQDESGNPVPGVRAEIHSESPYQYQVLYSGQDGKVAFKELSYAAKGTDFTFSYATTDGASDTRDLTLKTGEAALTNTVTLPTVATISGTMKNSGGEGIEGLYVLVGNRGGYTDINGAYTIRGQWAADWYDIQLADGQEYFYSGSAPRIQIQNGVVNHTAPDGVVTKGIDVVGRVLLKGAAYQKAYVSLYDEDGKLVYSGYGTPDGGYALPGAIKKTGDYTLKITEIFDAAGWYSVDYIADPVIFTVTDLTAQHIDKDLNADTKLNTSAFFRGDGNVMASSAMLVQENGKFDLNVKYRNNGDREVTAAFETTIINGKVDGAYIDGDYGKLKHVVPLQPGESGRYLIKAIADAQISGDQAITAETKVTVDGETFDFARLAIDVANMTFSTRTTGVKTGEGIKVYGEAPAGSTIEILSLDGGLLGTTRMTENMGRRFSMELPAFEREGSHSIFAIAYKGTSYYLNSESLTFEVSAAPVELKRVKVDHLNYEDLPMNERVGVRSFTHMVDNSLVPDPLTVHAAFSGNVKKVTYHFAGMHYPAQKGSDGLWSAGINGWRSTGLQQLTATVTADGKEIEFSVAEVIILIDPSGRITDGDTGAPIPGAEVVCYKRNDDERSYSPFEAARYAAGPNPMRTDEDGRYGWMVPAGTYKISASKTGYVGMESGEIAEYENGVEVPPPALDVNLSLPPDTPMALLNMTGSNNKILAKFSRYVVDADVTVTDEGDNPVAVTVEADRDTLIVTGSLRPGVLYKVAFAHVEPKSGKADAFGLEYIDGTVRLSNSSPAPTPGVPETSGSSGGGSSGSGDGTSGGFFSKSNLISRVTISPDAIRRAKRSGKNVLATMTGAKPRTTGAAIAKALELLKTGESLVLRKYETGNKVQYQFQIDPQTLTVLPKNLDLSVTANARDTKKVRGLFQKYFTNPFAAVQCGQQGTYGFRAKLALKLDLSQLDVKTLRVYQYNGKANTYTHLPEAAPYVDQNGFLHMMLDGGGTFLITDGEWTKK